MDDVRERLFAVAKGLKNPRSRERVADILTAVVGAAKETKEKGDVLLSMRSEPDFHWRLNDGEVKRLERTEKKGKTPPLLEVTVDPDRLEQALARAANMQQLAMASGMRVVGSSPFISEVVVAINRAVFPKGEASRG